jgi:hypothetical protein
MDFAAELAAVAAEMERQGRGWVVIGGVALAGLGMPRTTLDLDIAVDATAQEPLVSWLEGRGFSTLHRSPGYSNHLRSEPPLARIDLVYVRGETADRLFAEARQVPGPGGLTMPVPRPEHLAAMKALAIRNDPGRVFQDLADVRFLLLQPGVDRGLVREHFSRHGLESHFDELLRTL